VFRCAVGFNEWRNTGYLAIATAKDLTCLVKNDLDMMATASLTECQEVENASVIIKSVH
jgi:hypothetical protein